MKRRRMSVLFSSKIRRPSCMTQPQLGCPQMKNGGVTTCSVAKSKTATLAILDGRSTAPSPHSHKQYRHRNHSRYTTRCFTCFGSANLGVPLNPRDAIYYQNTPEFVRLHRQSLWLRLQEIWDWELSYEAGPGSWAKVRNDEWTQFAAERRMVQMQTSSAGANVGLGAARNVLPPRLQGATYFQKEFFHKRLHQEPEATRTLLQYEGR